MGSDSSGLGSSRFGRSGYFCLSSTVAKVRALDLGVPVEIRRIWSEKSGLIDTRKICGVACRVPSELEL